MNDSFLSSDDMNESFMTSPRAVNIEVFVTTR
jgi:hypothetical protein